MQDDRVTVTDLLQASEACDPDAAVRLAPQPAWPFQYAIDPPAPPSGRAGRTPVVSLGQGAQLGSLSEAVRTQLGW